MLMQSFPKVHYLSKGIKPLAMILLASLLILMGCQSQEEKSDAPGRQFSHPRAQIQFLSDKIETLLAITPEEQAQGLSGVRTDDWPQNQAMLFVGGSMGPRSFWMPDTYFDLDIFFLDNSLKVVYIARAMPQHPGHQEPPAIARTPVIESQHVLEIRSSDDLAKKINVGDQLQWLGPGNLPAYSPAVHLEK